MYDADLNEFTKEKIITKLDDTNIENEFSFNKTNENIIMNLDIIYIYDLDSLGLFYYHCYFFTDV